MIVKIDSMLYYQLNYTYAYVHECIQIHSYMHVHTYKVCYTLSIITT